MTLPHNVKFPDIFHLPKTVGSQPCQSRLACNFSFIAHAFTWVLQLPTISCFEAPRYCFDYCLEMPLGIMWPKRYAKRYVLALCTQQRPPSPYRLESCVNKRTLYCPCVDGRTLDSRKSRRSEAEFISSLQSVKGGACYRSVNSHSRAVCVQTHSHNSNEL